MRACRPRSVQWLEPGSEEPRKADWIHKLTEILAVLEQAPDALLDRTAITALFGISNRQAIRILNRTGASSVGGAFIIQARDLGARIRQFQSEGWVIGEQQRRHRLEQDLTAARREIRARRVVIPTPPTEGPIRLSNLPQGIRLSPGLLEVRFTTPVELLQCLMQLAQAIAEDWPAFEDVSQ